ncbi:low-density lipoprotein receptor-related protein-like [Branchiostoma floridae]|uniref:Low-density lipoprotein receptor-related protein-like n=1 Tax=Branchiostoma floridae TaxID=7739 RepID=A0A9J7KHA5_BRAFL|nr:low-density lipoprotein receptor-related protein-like [Branchiostoma floridae]
MANDGAIELQRQNGERTEDRIKVDVEAQNGQRIQTGTADSTRCKCLKDNICYIIAGVAMVIILAIPVTLLAVYLPGAEPPINGTAVPLGPASNGTTANPPVTLQPTNTIHHTTTKSILPATATAIQSESTGTTQHPRTQENTESSVTDSTTTTTITPTTTTGKSCSDQNLFECNNGDCISFDLVCDVNGIKHCLPDGEDEDNCPVRTCGADQFTCNDGTCIAEGWRCDRKEDCPNKDDELGCTTMMTTTT